MQEAGVNNARPTGAVVYLDLGFLRKKEGIVKITECVLDLIGFICIMSSSGAYHSRGTWFNTVAMGGFWYSLIMGAFYIFHLPDYISFIPWKKFEFIFCVIWTFFYLLAASLAASFPIDEAIVAGAFFGFIAMVVYGYDAWLSYRDLHGVVLSVITTNNATTTTTTTTHSVSPTQY